MQMRKRSKQSGFTLVELMVVLLVLTIVMGAVFNQVDKAQKTYSAEEAKVDLTQQAREQC